ncbi:hypothetical protein EDE08_12843 [Bradyrhizobium sp. R2.2-H]|jgi:hypothetical protein|nr:hypothetical protein EDE10_1283 [Bradyrhizobium sp. Y-H1]TCU63714.1 hypothetical protein EDE08_12843 [Bradyrhizobium sp. R2.2-H]
MTEKIAESIVLARKLVVLVAGSDSPSYPNIPVVFWGELRPSDFPICAR